MQEDDVTPTLLKNLSLKGYIKYPVTKQFKPHTHILSYIFGVIYILIYFIHWWDAHIITKCGRDKKVLILVEINNMTTRKTSYILIVTWTTCNPFNFHTEESYESFSRNFWQFSLMYSSILIKSADFVKLYKEESNIPVLIIKGIKI